jgi:hypothetical protein
MGAARLLAKGWVLFCVYGGGLALVRALAAGAPAAETAWTISVCVVLFGAMGLLFISGYGLSAGHVRLFGATGLKPSQITPGFNELVFLGFALVMFCMQNFYAPARHTGPVVDAIESAIRFAVFGQRAFADALLLCGKDGGRLFVSAVSWMLAFIFLASALSRVRLAAAIVRIERKRNPEALGAQPLAFALGLAAVAGVQLLYVGTGYRLLSCPMLEGIWGDTVIGVGPLVFAYLVVAALTNLLALGPED